MPIKGPFVPQQDDTQRLECFTCRKVAILDYSGIEGMFYEWRCRECRNVRVFDPNCVLYRVNSPRRQ